MYFTNLYTHHINVTTQFPALFSINNISIAVDASITTLWTNNNKMNWRITMTKNNIYFMRTFSANYIAHVNRLNSNGASTALFFHYSCRMFLQLLYVFSVFLF